MSTETFTAKIETGLINLTLSGEWESYEDYIVEVRYPEILGMRPRTWVIEAEYTATEETIQELAWKELMDFLQKYTPCVIENATYDE